MPVTLTDSSIMAFGKWRGTTLANIPAEYYIYLRSQPGWDETTPMGVYIESNAEVLAMQAKLQKAKDKFLRR